MVTADLDGKPFQLKFVRPSQMTMFAKILCNPPLGQTTVISNGEDIVKVTVLIESSISFQNEPWEAFLWHNGHQGGNWDGLQLQEVYRDNGALAITSKDRSKVYRHYFSAQLPRPASQVLEFTLKFKLASSSAWNWVNDRSSLSNGEILFQSKGLPVKIQDCFDNLSSAFAVEEVRSEVPDTHLWTLTKFTAHAGKVSGMANDKLGLPLDVSRWFALVRLWSPWLAPRHGKGHFKINEDGVLCSFLRRDGSHLVLLAVSGLGDVLTFFKHDAHGNVIVSSRNDNPSSGETHIIAALGWSFETANAACMYHARKLVTREEYRSGELKKEMEAFNDGDVKAEWMENWYDGLTYCTWNGLGQNLTQQKIFDALDTLKKNNIRITNLIIDDNWQSLDNPGASQFERGMTEFEANREGFPKGLAYAVTKIQDSHPNIENVAVWHAILGYWGGISPNGAIARKYKTKVVRRALGDSSVIKPGTMTVVDPDDVQKFYNDFYQFLLNCRVTACKTDAQFFLDMLVDPEDRRRFIKAYQDAWTINSLRYFSIKAISCMSQTPQILFHSQMPTNKPRLMVRNSDDFFPEIPTSHPWHIYVNAYNCLFTSHLNILPDWDMFQTSHDYAIFHAAGRCISGGPIYITDEPGKHDVDLIRQMTATTSKGKTIILRPSTVGKALSTGVYTAYEEERLLKVGSYHGSQGTGSGFIGVFNVSPLALAEFVMLHEFPGVVAGKEYVVRAHTTGEISTPMAVTDKLPLVSLELGIKSAEILTAYPLHTFSATKVAPLGLMGKMTGAAAIVGTESHVKESGKLSIKVTIKALGVLGIYISDLPSRTIMEDFLILILGKVIPVHTVSKSAVSECVLEIDVETAWKVKKLDSGWSNEVEVDIIMGL